MEIRSQFYKSNLWTRPFMKIIINIIFINVIERKYCPCYPVTLGISIKQRYHTN